MYKEKLFNALRKSQLVVFGTRIEIVLWNNIVPLEPAFFPSNFIPFDAPLERYADPYLQYAVAHTRRRADSFLIMAGRLDHMVTQAITRRPETNPDRMVWNIALKTIWEEVRSTFRKLDPRTRWQDAILGPVEIISCLPKNHLIHNEGDIAEAREELEGIFQDEMEAHRKELQITHEQEESGVLHFLVERNVIAGIAQTCANEAQMLGFVRRCKDLVLCVS